VNRSQPRRDLRGALFLFPFDMALIHALVVDRLTTDWMRGPGVTC